MCSSYSYIKDEAKLRLRDKILVYGAVPRANTRPTDLGPVMANDETQFFLPKVQKQVHFECDWPVLHA